MADYEDLTVVLPEPVARSIKAAVDAGDYASTSEVVREALRLWENRREHRARDLEALRAAYRDGKASGAPRPLDTDRILREADERLRDSRRG